MWHVDFITRFPFSSTILSTIFFCLLPLLATASDLHDVLLKRFKSTRLPYPEKTVRITIKTPINFIYGNSLEHDVLRSFKVHDKVTYSLKQNGWREDDPLLTDYIDAGTLGIETTESSNFGNNRRLRMRLYVDICDLSKKYRGENMDKFLGKVIEKMEYCITYKNDLQGKNYPY